MGLEDSTFATLWHRFMDCFCSYQAISDKNVLSIDSIVIES